jgi:RNA polymerase sigma factor (sigma-70 family)
VSKDAEREELDLVKSGDSNVLKRLYKKYRTPFIQWAHWKYAGTDAADIYQQAFTIFYFNVKDGKFTGMSSVRTYLFGIGKNLLNKLVQGSRQAASLEEVDEVDLPVNTIETEYEATHRQQVVSSILEKVGEPCKTILMRYYFDNFTMESIADAMGYKTAMVAKKKKCECLTKIRAVLRAREVQLKENE